MKSTAARECDAIVHWAAIIFIFLQSRNITNSPSVCLGRELTMLYNQDVAMYGNVWHGNLLCNERKGSKT